MEAMSMIQTSLAGRDMPKLASGNEIPFPLLKYYDVLKEKILHGIHLDIAFISDEKGLVETVLIFLLDKATADMSNRQK